MKLMLAVLATVLAAARADCEACINGRCHSKKTLIQGFHISDQLAIDRYHDVLYVQLNSNLNTAFFLEDLKIRLVQTLNTSGLTVDQDEHVLYTADYKKTLYKYEQDGNKTEVASTDIIHKEANLLFYKDMLYYTTKCCSGLYYINKNNTSRQYIFLKNYTITDFVVDFNDIIYFVADDIVYLYNRSWYHAPEVVIEKKYVLATDKYGDVYFGDATVNAIYKMNKETKKIVDYAAYKTGSVEKFVFDDSNNIVFQNSADESVNQWKPENTECTIESPHVKYLIKTDPKTPCNPGIYLGERQADSIPNANADLDYLVESQ